MKTLKDEAKIPTVIVKDCDIVLNHISKVSNWIKRGWRCRMFEWRSKKGRLYRLTDLGDEIVDNLAE